MKTEQKQKAEQLFFQTDLNNTQIADALGISRRTLHYWIAENNWERLKKSASALPSMIVENCYYAMMQLTKTILSEDRLGEPISRQEADTLYKLTMTINKLKARTSLNESMEMFAHFVDDVHSQKPELAKEIQPFVTNYIAARAAVQPSRFQPDKFNKDGLIPQPTGAEYDEEALDYEDRRYWAEQKAAATEPQREEAPKPQPAPFTSWIPEMQMPNSPLTPRATQTPKLNRRQRRALAAKENKSRAAA